VPSIEVPRSSTRELVRSTAPAGLGLLCVNVGYVAMLSLGAATARAHATGLEPLIVPVFGAVILLSRTLGGSVPDRLGGRRTACLFAAIEAVGLLSFALAATAPVEVAALLTLAVGQSLAVPGLGLLALARVPSSDQGAAAGLFFAWFDAGVGLGGPTVGAVAALAGPSGGLESAAAAVATVVLIAGVVGRSRRPTVRAAVEMR
jgi:predicted MFS family arabinose efflux permease